MTLTSIFLEAIIFFKTIVGVDKGSPDDEGGFDFKLDANTAATVFAIAYIFQGLIVRCFPARTARWYGWGESETITYVMTSHGDTVLFTGIGATCMLLFDCSVCFSIGAMLVANVVSQGLLIFNPKFQQFRNATFYVIWASTIVGAYAGLAETSWCATFYKVLATFHALVAAQIVFFPSVEAASKMLNLPPSSSYDDTFLALARKTGLFYLGLEAFGLMVLYGEDAALAFGCAALFGLVHFFDALFVTKTARKQTLSCMLYVVWLVFFLTMIPLCLGLVGVESAIAASDTQ